MLGYDHRVADKTERLLNLIALLLDTRRPLTPDEIRDKIPGYGGSHVAFRRMFERDKEEIRELGLPLERVDTDAWGGTEGYVISKEQATIPDLDLTSDERAALMLAAQAWQGEAVPGDPDRALIKLSLASGDRGDAADTGAWLRARVDASAPVLGALLDAIERRKRVSFRYRTGGGGEAHERSVDPYGLRHRGSWYLAGYDHDRGEIRHFKLERIDGGVKVAAGPNPDFDSPGAIDTAIPRGPWAGEGAQEARVRFSPDAAWWVERRTGARRLAERDDGSVEMSLPFDDPVRFLSWILGFAGDAELIAPEDLRAEALERLRRAAEVTAVGLD